MNKSITESLQSRMVHFADYFRSLYSSWISCESGRLAFFHSKYSFFPTSVDIVSSIMGLSCARLSAFALFSCFISGTCHRTYSLTCCISIAS